MRKKFFLKDNKNNGTVFQCRLIADEKKHKMLAETGENWYYAAIGDSRLKGVLKMEQDIFQKTAAKIQESFPERRDTLLLLLLDKPDDERLRLMAQQQDGFKDCLQLAVYTNRKVIEILAALREEFSSLRTDPASTEQWDAAALLIKPDGQMQVSFDDDRILDHWDRPEFIFFS